jgi:hypothetical protein
MSSKVVTAKGKLFKIIALRPAASLAFLFLARRTDFNLDSEVNKLLIQKAKDLGWAKSTPVSAE